MSESRRLTVALMLGSDGPGGAEFMVLHTAEELRRRGHEVCPIGPDDGSGWLAEQFRDAGFEPEVFSNTSMLDWKCVRGLGEVFKRRGIDTVHSHEFGMAVYGAAASMAYRRPHVITMHGGRYYDTRSRRRLALRWALRRSRAAVAVSRATRGDLEQTLRLPPGSLHVVYNGIVHRPGERAGVRAELGLDDQSVLLASVGNLYPVKGYDVLLQALHGVRETTPIAWHLAIAGRGDEETKLRATATELGLDDRVHLLGFRQDVPDILAAADIFLMPSRSEGLPVALLESMFAAKPSIASRVGGIPEVITDGAEGVLVPPGDPVQLAAAIGRLLTDPDSRERLGRAARATAVSRFSLESMVDAYECLYLGTGTTSGDTPE